MKTRTRDYDRNHTRRDDRRDEREERRDANQPVKKFKMWVGSSVILDVAVWENERGEGKKTYTTYSTTVERSYKDDKDEWHRQDRPSFNLTELAVLMFMLQQAAAWIVEQKSQ